jgi:hypothetical protein
MDEVVNRPDDVLEGSVWWSFAAEIDASVANTIRNTARNNQERGYMVMPPSDFKGCRIAVRLPGTSKAFSFQHIPTS